MWINFVILLALVKLLDKDNESDWFQVLAATIFPVILTAIFSMALGLLKPPMWLTWTPLLVLAGVAFFTLRKILNVPSRRALGISITFAMASLFAEIVMASVAGRAD